MKMRQAVVLTTGILTAVLLLSAPVPAKEKPKAPGVSPLPQVQEARLSLRELWSAHIFWVRNVVLATRCADAGAVKTAEDQTARNARSIADAFAPYYGKEGADKFFTLFSAHNGAIREYMNAAYAWNAAGKKAAIEKLRKNTEETAALLSSANPNWKKDGLPSLLAAHSGHHIAQVDAIVAGDFGGDAGTWAAMKVQVNTIADVLTDGLAKQFPMRFSR
jgi:hypothetical protein